MLRRGLGVGAVLLVFAAPAAAAGTLGPAEVRSADGTLIGKAGGGAYAYPADGSVLQDRLVRGPPPPAWSFRTSRCSTAAITVRRLVVPARGLAGSRVDGLVVDGTSFVVGPNAIIPLHGGSYIVALQEAVSPGAHGLWPRRRCGHSSPIRRLGSRPAHSFSSASPALRIRTLGTSRAAAVLGCRSCRPHRHRCQACRRFSSRRSCPRLTTLGGQAVALCVSLPRGAVRLGRRFARRLRLLRSHDVRVRPARDQARAITPGSSITPDSVSLVTSFSREISCSSARTRPACPQHEGMYIGNGSFIQAPHTGDVVKISSLFEAPIRARLRWRGPVPMPPAPGRRCRRRHLPSWTSASG